MNAISPKKFLRDLFQAGLDAADPRLAVPDYLPTPPKGRTVVIGAGKAAAAMAKAVEENWEGPIEGLVVTRYDHDMPQGEKCTRIEVVEAAHPVPDAAGREAAKRIYEMVQGLSADDLVLCLISGGGSSLLALPADGLSLEDKQTINKALLKSGANIIEMNTVRKHLSAIKGGQLAAAAAPAQMVSLLISDVPGDDPDVIASGPTVPDPSTFADTRAILAKYDITPPASVAAHLEKAANETPKPNDPVFANCSMHMISRPQDSLDAAKLVAEKHGFTPVVLGDSIEGEAREVAKVMAAIARQVTNHNQPAQAPCVLLSGGETTVTVKGNGRGGRNAEFLLALAVELDGAADIYALACDTDGIDGSEDNAGAILSPDTLERAEKLGISAKEHLANNDGYSFFEALDDLMITGPTRTNVNDFRAIVVMPKS
ncbi:glycerate kinase type-2 family protein [Kiloniella majae]|uniref:glycerate kinase type-2 family protein n=1 Tax=Kiloniella majae TaxID=1938558 RepID=UPI000A27754F|nr:glycerate kinase [Kiloniella majae]